MKQLTEQQAAGMRRDYLDDVRPSQILRVLAVQNPDFGSGHLIRAMIAAFGVSHSDVACLGGWWHCGTSELSDEIIDAELSSAIKGALLEGKWIAEDRSAPRS